MFTELQQILETFNSYDFDAQVILNRNVIIKAYLKVKRLREHHGFDIDFEDSFWAATEILGKFGINLPKFSAKSFQSSAISFETPMSAVNA